MHVFTILHLLAMPPQSIANLNRTDAKVVTYSIEKQYGLGRSGFREWVQGKEHSDDPAYLWPFIVLVSAYATGTKIDPVFYGPRLEMAKNVLLAYWANKDPGGFAASPTSGDEPDRYYDDNAWVALAMLEGYQSTGDVSFLGWATQAYTFTLSGADDKQGGGIYWREKEKKSKNICATAPAAAFAYKWYEATGDQQYLQNASQLLDWCSKYVDKSGLLADSVSLDGKVDSTEWSYNTALYVEALIGRYKKDGGAADKEAAIKCLNAGLTKWFNPSTGAFNDPGYFAMHFVDALYEAADAFAMPDFATKADQIVGFAVNKCSVDHGLFAERWTGPPKPTDKLILHTQASILRALLAYLSRPNR